MSKPNRTPFNLAQVGNLLNPSYNLAYDGLIYSLADLMLSSYMQVSSLCFYVEGIELGLHEKRANLSILSRLVNQVQACLQSSIFSISGYITEAASSLKVGENNKNETNLEKLQHGFDYSMLSEDLSKLERADLLEYCIKGFLSATKSILHRRQRHQMTSNSSFKKLGIQEFSIQNLDSIFRSKPQSPIELKLPDSHKDSIELFKRDSGGMDIRRNASPKIKKFESIRRFQSKGTLSNSRDSRKEEDNQASVHKRLNESLYFKADFDVDGQGDQETVHEGNRFYFQDVVNRARKSLQTAASMRKAKTGIRERGLRQTVADISSGSRLREYRVHAHPREGSEIINVKTSMVLNPESNKRSINSKEILKYITIDENPNNEVTIYSKKGSLIENSAKSIRLEALRQVNETVLTKDKYTDRDSHLHEVKSTFRKLNSTLNELADRMSNPSASQEPVRTSIQTKSLMNKVSATLQKYKAKEGPVSAENSSFKWISSLFLT
jgi:hypothetical protein